NQPFAPAQPQVGQQPAAQQQSQPSAPAPVLSGLYNAVLSVSSNPGMHPTALLSVTSLNLFITRDRAVEPNPVIIELTIGGMKLTGNTQIGLTFDSPGGSFTANAYAPYQGYMTS